VKRAEVEAAFDHVTIERAVSKIGEAVGAAGLGGVKDALDIVDRHELIAHLAADHAIDRNIRDGADGNRIFCHGLLTSSLKTCVGDKRVADRTGTIGCALATPPKSARGPAGAIDGCDRLARLN
jgi:hypothetical protein